MIIQIVSLYHSLSETDLFLKMNYSKSLYSLSSTQVDINAYHLSYSTLNT